MADYFMAFIITDSVMKKIDDKTEDKSIVAKANVAEADGSIPQEYVPFNACYIKGERDAFGKMCEYIKGDTKTIVVGGNTIVGVFPIPWEETYTVGDNFTSKHIFQLIKDGSHRKQGMAKIEHLILGKTKNDTDGIVNYFAEVNTTHGFQVQYAEESNPDSPYFDPYGDYPDESPAASQAAELRKAEEDEYEAFLIREAELVHPSQRNYQNNV